MDDQGSRGQQKKGDEWDLPELKDPGKKWSERTTRGRILVVLLGILKVSSLLSLLYLFICSLSFLASAFRLLGGKAAGRAFAENEILTNPVAGLMIGVLVTVLVQSSSTSTSIVVAMVASKILKVKTAIPIVMGANIGTTVTNTIVSLGQSIDRAQFRLAFAAATVHDMFNVLNVIILLPVEVISDLVAGEGLLFFISKRIVGEFHLEKNKNLKQDYLSKITKPFTNKVVQIDKGLIEKIAKATGEAQKKLEEKSLIKEFCTSSFVNKTTLEKHVNVTIVNGASQNTTWYRNVTQLESVKNVPCDFWFHGTSLSDNAVGVIMLAASLLMLCICLVCIVKLLNSMFRGRMASITRKVVNTNFPHPFGFLTGYIAMLVGAVLTFFVQSSSIFTSALTPLVGCGVVSIYRMYPLTLGSNIGTTTTAILAAFAADSSELALTLQIALCHLFFNIFGIMIWYPVPIMRKLPIGMAKVLGNTTAQYRWFAFIYIFVVFFIIPGACFGISLAGWQVFAGIFIPIGCLIVAIVVINVLQNKKPSALPVKMRTWDWAPKCMTSLEPYDRVLVKSKSVLGNKLSRKKRSHDLDTTTEMTNKGTENGGYEGQHASVNHGREQNVV